MLVEMHFLIPVDQSPSPICRLFPPISTLESGTNRLTRAEERPDLGTEAEYPVPKLWPLFL
jgi:hypothetical protein